MKRDNKKQNKRRNERNDFNYAALLLLEEEKINNAKYDFQSPRLNFQKELKTKIFEQRHAKQNQMNKIFEILTTSLSLPSKYPVSALVVVILFFVGAHSVLTPEERVEVGVNESIQETIIKKIRDVFDLTEKEDDWQYGVIAEPKEKIDDWKYAIGGVNDTGKKTSFFKTFSQAVPSMSGFSSFIESESIGLSTGGAKNVSNFRENIENGYLPLPTDITYEGLFYNYYFDTGENEPCNKLFCPSYSYAVSNDPFSEDSEYYLSVGLNSGIKQSDFERKKLNLVVVLDISGSMSSSFNAYYYDKFGTKIEVEEESSQKSKMQIANESVVALLSHLRQGDRFGMVLFNSGAHFAKPLRLVGETDIDKIGEHILGIQANGGTNMSAGMKMGTEMFDELRNVDQSEYENRIIFLTDAMPNIGATDKNSLLGMTKKNADNKLHTTFIGIGVDFQTELIESITKVRGANYYSVHSSKEFERRMDDEFEYMVTPLVFDLTLTLESKGYDIEKVYGSPEANEATGEIMKVSTLFPSNRAGDEIRGGLVLLKLKKISPSATLDLKVEYEDRTGRRDSDKTRIKITRNAEYFENTGIRKGILLTRYATLMKNWINDERWHLPQVNQFVPCITYELGIIDPCPRVLGQWERQAVSLQVASTYEDLFRKFKIYFEGEMSAIGDSTLDQEVKIMEKLIRY